MNAPATRLNACDVQWCLAANRLGARQSVRAYFRMVSHLGDGAFWYALIAMLAVLDGSRGVHASAHMAVVGGIALLVYRRLKRWTKRRRPFAVDGRIQAWVAPMDEFSFPSGHTLHAVSFTIVAVAWYPALAWILFPFTLSVALSRVVLGMHYPSDVLAATAMGVCLGSASLWLLSSVAPFG